MATRTRILLVDPVHPDPDLIREAAACVKRGGLVAFPTETVYGIAANLNDPQAIQELYFIKQRPFDKQVTIHLADAAGLVSYGVRIPPLAQRLMDRFWPGPLTIVLPRPDGSTLGFRVPNHPVALALLAAADVPVVAPSANLTGKPAPSTAQDVLRDLQDKIDFVIDAGPTAIGVSSTVVDFSGEVPRILREGARLEEIQRALLE